jgi:hypothetical protein
MSLPAAQQRILDGIADGLRRSEPRLAAMYATFTRMCGSEGPPSREQLARGWARRRAAAVGMWLRGKLTDQGRRARRRILIASQVAISLVLVVVLAGLSSRSSASCGQAGRRVSAAQTRLWCPTAANGMIGK